MIPLNLSPPHTKVISVPITPRALSYFWVGILWVALTTIWHEGSIPTENCPSKVGNTWWLLEHPARAAVCFPRDSAQAALPELGVCVWPPAPSLHLLSQGGERNMETLSSELSFNGVNDPFPSPSDPWEIRDVKPDLHTHRLKPIFRAPLQKCDSPVFF